MAEEAKGQRLSKVAKEVNVSVGNIREFLAKKGVEIDSNPNAKLTPEQYALVLKEFQSDKAISEKAQELKLETVSKKTAVQVAEPEKEPVEEEAESADSKELFIKTSEISVAKPAAKKKSETKAKAEAPVVEVAQTAEQPESATEESAAPVAAAKEKKTKKKAADKADKTVEAEEEQQAAVEAEAPVAKGKKAAEVRQEAEEPAASEPAAPAKSEEEPVEVPAVEEAPKADIRAEVPHITGPKIVSTIDLDSLKPGKKGKEAKTEKAVETTPAVAAEEPVASVPAAPVAAAENGEKPAPSQPAVPDNFIKTQYVKLEGPVVTGQKVDLSQFERKPKPVASSKDSQNVKKRRKRIKEEGGQGTQGGGLQKPSLQKGGNNVDKKNKNRKDNKKGATPVVDDVEIEKQIKETLARLSPLGKSKTSKHRREKRAMVSQHMEEEMAQEMLEKKTLKVTEFVTVSELATMMNIPATQIISTCMSLGLFVSINQRLSAEPISLLAEEYGFKLEFVDADVIHEIEAQEDDDEGEETGRTPIVTVMGHVDHGKTSLLDYIRKTNVIAGEAGGITQHIGAYEVQLEDGRKITFLDTPGHEAFTAMRARGAKMTDIAIIVVAADDNIMPQTKEAINHAQAAGVPIVFAINKIDKDGADPERIKQQLAEMNLLVEDWGGKYQSQDISAKKGIGVENLLEKVLLEAEMLDLKAHPEKKGKGVIIESSLDKGRGYVAKVLVQDGTLRVGDFVLAGYTYGRIKAMYNERNQAVKEAGPSQPVLLLGLNGAPQPGDVLNMMADEREAKDIASRRQQLQREQGLRTQKHITLDEIGRRIAIGDFKELNIIVKADVDGSVEALSDSLLKLSTPEVQVNVIHKSVGQISESDVMLASASNAVIVGFQVRPSVGARKLAESEQIDIRLYSIIYTAIEEIKDAIEGMLSPEIQEKIVANLEIREVFKISKVGSVAGCMVLDGKLARNTNIRIIRDGIVAYTGKLGSLRRFKDDVKEVVAGQDCGLNIENFNDIKVGDIIEGYDTIEVKRTL